MRMKVQRKCKLHFFKRPRNPCKKVYTTCVAYSSLLETSWISTFKAHSLAKEIERNGLSSFMGKYLLWWSVYCISGIILLLQNAGKSVREAYIHDVTFYFVNIYYDYYKYWIIKLPLHDLKTNKKFIFELTDKLKLQYTFF